MIDEVWVIGFVKDCFCGGLVVEFIKGIVELDNCVWVDYI